MNPWLMRAFLTVLGMCAGLGLHLWLRKLPSQLHHLEGPALVIPACLAKVSRIVPSCALIWFVCAWHWDVPTQALAWSIFVSLLWVMAVIDGCTTWLPDGLTQPLMWLGLVASLIGWIDTSLEQAVTGAVVGYLFLWATATAFEFITGKVGMGGGDFKLLAALGAWLGPLALLPVLLIASCSGALIGWWMLRHQRLCPHGYVPFGPFLALAGMVMAW